jgi:hypothetical protein
MCLDDFESATIVPTFFITITLSLRKHIEIFGRLLMLWVTNLSGYHALLLSLKKITFDSLVCIFTCGKLKPRWVQRREMRSFLTTAASVFSLTEIDTGHFLRFWLAHICVGWCLHDLDKRKGCGCNVSNAVSELTSGERPLLSPVIGDPISVRWQNVTQGAIYSGIIELNHIYKQCRELCTIYMSWTEVAVSWCKYTLSLFSIFMFFLCSCWSTYSI